jgi:hypothetical protein
MGEKVLMLRRELTGGATAVLKVVMAYDIGDEMDVRNRSSPSSAAHSPS